MCFDILILASFIITLHLIAKPTSIYHHTVGRETNSAQFCDNGMVAITDAALPRCTSIAIFWIKNWRALLSPVCSMTREPIRCTNERALNPQVPRVSTQREEKWKVVVKLEYFLNLADSTEFASLLAPLEEVDTLEGARVLEQVKVPKQR